jgi:hypothetical protein
MSDEALVRPLAAAQHTAKIIELKPTQRPDTARRHVLNRGMQEKSGRLYCNEDMDVELPSLEIYAAR